MSDLSIEPYDDWIELPKSAIAKKGDRWKSDTTTTWYSISEAETGLPYPDVTLFREPPRELWQ